MQTKNGIELDLSKSNYKYRINNYVFYFSSEKYLNKFKDEIENYTEIENTKMNIKYKVIIDLTVYLSFALYKKIEKRGFYVTYCDYKLQENEINFNSTLF